jgi:hypothetical protein
LAAGAFAVGASGWVMRPFRGVPVRAGPVRSTYRVQYYLNREATPLTERAVKRGFRRWAEATDFDFVYAGRHTAGLRRDGKNTVSFLLRWPEEIPPKTAYCRNWRNRRGDIVESDIIFNMTIARFTTLETRTPEAYYIEGVLAHEIGHMLGLSHIEAPGCLMRAFSRQKNPTTSDELTRKP